jgi:D-alanyl-lipoteichoic acid acyltransferase DltB (MBOAT superfamily)
VAVGSHPASEPAVLKLLVDMAVGLAFWGGAAWLFLAYFGLA